MTDDPRDVSMRAALLYKGAKLTDGDRNTSYGDPAKSMMDIAWLWKAYLDSKYDKLHLISAEDVAHMMTLMKIARTFTLVYHEDNYVDGAVYQAIAAECASDAAGVKGEHNADN